MHMTSWTSVLNPDSPPDIVTLTTALPVGILQQDDVMLLSVLQTFIVAEPAWLKFLQFRFLSHHGSEPMCALNDVLVFGKSAAEDLEDQLSDETLLQDSADVGAAKTARPVTADDVSNTQPGQLQPVLLAAVQGEAGPMDRADASRAAGLQHGALQAGNASGVSKAANEQQAANSTAGSHPQGECCLACVETSGCIWFTMQHCQHKVCIRDHDYLLVAGAWSHS